MASIKSRNLTESHPSETAQLFSGWALREADERARQLLENFAEETQKPRNLDPIPAAAERTAMRALIHRYTMLLLDGRLKFTLADLSEHLTPEVFFDVVLDVIDLSQAA